MTDDAKLASEAPVQGELLPEGEEAPPPGTRTMAMVRWGLVVLMAFAAAGAWLHHARDDVRPGGAAAALYRCPMHPAVVQDRPGSCSICGMDLVAEQAGAAQSKEGHAGEQHASAALAKGAEGAKPEPGDTVPGLVAVDLSGDRRQLMGMRTARAMRRMLPGKFRAVGFVSANEQKVAVVTARASGWIEELKVAQSGQRVRAGDVLLTLYSGEMLSAQQAFVSNVRWKQNLASSPNANNPAAQNVDKESLRRLQLYGMAQVDIDALAKSGKPRNAIPIRSPIAGWVARKSVLPGQFVSAGSELYQIADLSTVWVVAELPEQELVRVAVGQNARLALAAYPGASFEGRVGFIYPAVNPESRTLEALMEFRNPDLKLRPGMYGDVFIDPGGTEALVVPVEAVVDTGELQYVFVTRGESRFEPRVVRMGTRAGDQVEILSGLTAGDEVVTTANFYVDAESRLRAALEGQGATEATGVRAR